MKQRSILLLTRGPLSWPIDRRPLAIGRLPENDVVVDGDEVSRVHAYVVPTPEGALLVDRSRHGTWVNGTATQMPWPLEEGDEVRIGQALFQLRRGVRLRESAGAERPPEFESRLRAWVRRYGPSELVSTVAAVGAAVAVQEATGSTVAAAYAGSLSETTVFYGIMFLRESVREAHQAGLRGKPYGSKDLVLVLRDLLLEFGAAEAIDTLILRPLCMGMGIRWLGGKLGALVGKLVADLAFYGPVLAIYEWRLARDRATRVDPRRRRTTASHIGSREE